MPSTSAASIGGPHGQGVSTTDCGICSSTGGDVDFASPVVAVSVVSLCPCGTYSTAPGSGDYL